MLTQKQVEQYKRDGFLFPIDVFSNAQAADYRRRIEDLEADPDNAKLPRPLARYFRSNAYCVLPIAAELATNPDILDFVEAIIGPDILIWSCEFFIKEPHTDKVVSWHQDMTYWGLGEETSGDTEHLVSAWIALSPATVDSGCMRYVAGSHKQSIVEHVDTFAEDNLLSRGQEIAVEVDEADATDVVLQPGQMALHHGRMFHASGPNVSDDRRIGMVIRYVTPEVRQLVGNKDYAMLARGCDAGNNWNHVAPPARPFTPRSLEIFDEVVASQMTALSDGAEKTFSYEK